VRRRSAPWKKLKIEDEFLLGLSEPGFQEVEELTDPAALGEDMLSLLAQADAALGLKGCAAAGHARAPPPRLRSRRRAQGAQEGEGQEEAEEEARRGERPAGAHRAAGGRERGA